MNREKDEDKQLFENWITTKTLHSKQNQIHISRLEIQEQPRLMRALQTYLSGLVMIDEVNREEISPWISDWKTARLDLDLRVYTLQLRVETLQLRDSYLSSLRRLNLTHERRLNLTHERKVKRKT